MSLILSWTGSGYHGNYSPSAAYQSAVWTHYGFSVIWPLLLVLRGRHGKGVVGESHGGSASRFPHSSLSPWAFLRVVHHIVTIACYLASVCHVSFHRGCLREDALWARSHRRMIHRSLQDPQSHVRTTLSPLCISCYRSTNRRVSG